MKVTLRIPTADQYAFCEVELEDYPTLSPGLIKETYDEITAAFKQGDGLPTKELDAFIERQISGHSNHVEEYNKMSPEQQKYVQIIKRAMNRITYKINNPKQQ